MKICSSTPSVTAVYLEDFAGCPVVKQKIVFYYVLAGRTLVELEEI